MSAVSESYAISSACDFQVFIRCARCQQSVVRLPRIPAEYRWLLILVCLYRFTTQPHPHGHWQLQELLRNRYRYWYPMPVFLLIYQSVHTENYLHLVWGGKILDQTILKRKSVKQKTNALSFTDIHVLSLNPVQTTVNNTSGHHSR